MAESFIKGIFLHNGMTKCHSAKEAMTEIYAKTGLAHLLLIYGVSAQSRTQTE
jgi:hypothetical protein